MSISIKCPSCGKAYQTAETLLGKRVKCKQCGTAILVAAPETEPVNEAWPEPLSSALLDDVFAVAPPLSPSAPLTSRPPASMKKPKPAAARKKSAPSTPAWRLPALIGGGIGLVLLLVAVGIVLALRGGGATSDNSAAPPVASAPPPNTPPAAPPPAVKPPTPSAAPPDDADNVAQDKAAEPEIVPPPAGEIEALEDFDPNQQFAEERLAPLAATTEQRAFSNRDRSYLAKTTAYQATGAGEYAVERSEINVTGSQTVTRTITGAIIANPGGGLGTTKAVPLGEYRATAFRRAQPEHFGVYYQGSAGDAVAAAMAESQKLEELRQIQEQEEALRKQLQRQGQAPQRGSLGKGALSDEQKRLQQRLQGLVGETPGDQPLRTGRWFLYYDNGRPRVVGGYAQGQRHGRFVCYDNQARPRWEGIYANGHLLKSRAIAPTQLSLYAEKRELPPHRCGIAKVAFSSDGGRLMTVSAHETGELTGLAGLSEVRVWDTSTWELLYSLPLTDAMPDVRLAPDGKSFVVLPADRQAPAALWSTSPARKLAEFQPGWWQYQKTGGAYDTSSVQRGTTSPQGRNDGFRHTRASLILTFSADGRYFAAVTPTTLENGKVSSDAKADGVRLWDCQSGAQLAAIAFSEWSGQTTPAIENLTLEFSRGARFLLIGAQLVNAGWATAAIDVEAGKLLGRVGDENLLSIKPADDGRASALRTTVADVQVRQALIRQPRSGDDPYAISHDGRWLLRPEGRQLSGYQMVGYHLPAGNVAYRIDMEEKSDYGHSPKWRLHDLSPDGALFSVAASDGKTDTMVRRLATGDTVATLPAALTNFRLSHGGQYAVALIDGSADVEEVIFRLTQSTGGRRAFGGLEVWSLLTRQAAWFVGPTVMSNDTYAASPDWSTLVTGYTDGSLLVWNVEDAFSIFTQAANNRPPTVSLSAPVAEISVAETVRVSVVGHDPDDDRVGFEFRIEGGPWQIDADGSIQVFGEQAGELSLEVRAVDSHGAASEPLRSSLHIVANPWLEWREVSRFVLGNAERPITVLRDGKSVQAKMRPETYQGLLYSPNGDILSGFSNSTMCNWKPPLRGRPTIVGGSSSIHGIAAYSPDAKTICTGTSGGALNLWSASLRSVKSTGREHKAEVLCVAYNADGTLLASSGMRDKSVIIWRAADAKPLRRFQLDDDAWSIAFSPDGALLACATSGGIELRAVSDGGKLATLAEGNVTSGPPRFTPDGKQLIALNHSFQALQVFDLADLSLSRSMAYGTDVTATALQVTADATLAAVSRNDGAIVLFQIADGKTLTTLRGHAGRISSIALSSDGTRLASAGDDRTVRIWGRPSETAEAVNDNGDASADEVRRPSEDANADEPSPADGASAKQERGPKPSTRDLERKAERELKLAKLLTGRNPDAARERLRRVIADYPDTPAAEEAKKVLAELK